MTSRVTLSLLTLLALPLVVRAEAPRYRWQPNAQFVYRVHVTADTPVETETMSGYIVFDVVSASEPLKVKYKGGVSKTTKRKPGANTGPAFGPFGAPPLPPPGPFSRRVNPFQGLEQTTNEIVMTPEGEILAVTGSSQLPYLLGNLSLLVFEPLPQSDQRTWKVDSGVVITEKSEQQGRAGFFDPFAGRGGNGQDKQSAGGQSTSFTFVSEKDDLAVYQRTYRLHSPGDKASLTINGSGRWTFNHQLGVSESLDFKQTLNVKEDNVEVSVPMTIRYERVPAEEWAKLEKDRLAREDELRAMAERKSAEAKAAAAAPIAGDERTKILGVLSAGKQPQLGETLKTLSGKTARDDEALAKAIQPHLDHSDAAVANLAKAALAAFSPEYKRVYDLNRAYQRSFEVKEVGYWISYDTPLPPGLIVAANNYHFPSETQYFPATIVGPLDNGLVRVKYQERGGMTGDRLREDMFLAPSEVEQPHLPPQQLAELRAYEDQLRKSVADSPETEQLIRAYRDGKQPLPKVGDPLPDGLQLPRFLVLAAKRNGQWYQAHVEKELPDGRVELRFSGDRFNAKLPRADLRLPPPEVKEPNVTPPYQTAADTPAPVAEFRTWTDSTGKFKIEAKFAGTVGQSIRLIRKDGKELVVPLARLSEADQKHVATLAKPTNPFDQ